MPYSLNSKRWALIQLSFCHNNKETSSKRYGKLTEVCICSKALPHYSMSAQIMSRFMMFYKQSPMLRVFCIWHEQCRLFVPISVESGLSMNKKKIIFKVLCLLHYVLTATCILRPAVLMILRTANLCNRPKDVIYSLKVAMIFFHIVSAIIVKEV